MGTVAGKAVGKAVGRAAGKAVGREAIRVLVAGGTGSIGGALIEVLQSRGHRVTCLVRSKESELRLRKSGFNTLRGDITDPYQWIDSVADFDAVVPVAATWDDDMAFVDAQLTNLLIEALATPNAEKILIYTSGCWVYGQTGDQIAIETTAHCSSSEFAWCSGLHRAVVDSEHLTGMVILPAMVYERDGGVLDPMIDDAKKLGKIRLVGSDTTRWSMVHRYDLAMLFALMLERGEQGSVYNGAAMVGLQIGEIARVLSRRYQLQQPPEVISVDEAVATMGSWASGYSIDQQMSGQKAMRELAWQPEYADVLAEIK